MASSSSSIAPYSSTPYPPSYTLPTPYGGVGGGGFPAASYVAYSSSSSSQQHRPAPPPRARYDASLRVEDWDTFERLCKPSLLGGIAMYKHSRNGLARERRFWVTPSLRLLCWDSSKLLSILNSNVDSIALAEVIEVREDLGQRAGLGDVRNGACFISLLTRKRTLDLESTFLEQGYLILRGLQFLCQNPVRRY